MGSEKVPTNASAPCAAKAGRGEERIVAVVAATPMSALRRSTAVDVDALLFTLLFDDEEKVSAAACVMHRAAMSVEMNFMMMRVPFQCVSKGRGCCFAIVVCWLAFNCKHYCLSCLVYRICVTSVFSQHQLKSWRIPPLGWCFWKCPAMIVVGPLKSWRTESEEYKTLNTTH